MKQRNNSQTNGTRRTFTLVEMLIVAVIMGLLALGMSYVLVSSNKMWTRGSSLLELQTDLHLGFERIAKQLREATWVTAPQDGTQLVFYTPDDSGIIQKSVEGTLVILRGDYEAGSMENVYPGDDLASLGELKFALRAGEVNVSLTLTNEGENVSGDTVIETRNLDMVGRWGMDEGDGVTAFDASQAANNSALYDTAWTAGSDGGRALQFSPSSPSYVAVPDSSAVDLGERVVVDALVRLASGSQSTPTLLSRGGWQADQAFHLGVCGQEFGPALFCRDYGECHPDIDKRAPGLGDRQLVSRGRLHRQRAGCSDLLARRRASGNADVPDSLHMGE